MTSESLVLEWGNDQDRQPVRLGAPARDRTLSEEGVLE